MPLTSAQLFRRTKSLEINQADIDSQHQELVPYLNELADAMRESKGKTVVGRLLDKLVSYTQQHFQHEEALMRARRHPDVAFHVALHPDMAEQVQDFLKDWLRNHTGGVDRRAGIRLAHQK